MRPEAADLGRGSPSRRFALARRSLIVTLLAASGLTACGGSTRTKASTHTVASATTGSAPSAPGSTTQTSTSAGKPAHRTRARREAHRTSAATHRPTRTTIATTSPSRPGLSSVPTAPKYSGPSPTYCLTAAGLNRARRATTSSHVWQANLGKSPLRDGNAIVFLSGPFESATAAKSLAQRLLGVDLAVSGGRWVASAARSSHLGRAVDRVTSCMTS